MIYLATSRQSYDQLTASRAWPPAALWVSCGVLDQSELTRLRKNGIAVTEFTEEFNPGDPDDMGDAIDMIRQHHPGQMICVDGSTDV